MFDVGWSEMVVVAVVALIAIGPKELPGVLRMVGQWMGKVRRMASDFQGQFNEAMREAEMADIKQQFDEIKDTAKSFTGANLLTETKKDVDEALKFEDKPYEDNGDGASSPDTAPSVNASAATGSTDNSAVESTIATTGIATSLPASTAAPAVNTPIDSEPVKPSEAAAPLPEAKPDAGTVNTP